MSDYKIITDSGCDIGAELLNEWGVTSLSLTFRFSEDDKEYSNNEMDIKEFYNRMRDGGVAKTSAVNIGAFEAEFRKTLEAGLDILYIGFSSGLSTTFNSARLAAESLKGDFPERSIKVIDSLCASAGQGLLVYLAAEKKNGGASLDEAYEYVNSLVPSVCHWFTVDDLVYLKRGGRVSAVAALVGGMLGIKPVLHVDDEGHLINVSKVRGRKTAVIALADKYGELALNPTEGPIFISHADCLKDAEDLASIMKTKYGAPDVQVITDVGTVIGAHAGPGTLALFFLGKNR